MRTYEATGIVKRTVIDTITVRVKVEDETEVPEKASLVLASFPKEHHQEGASYCYIENRDNVDTEVLEIKDIRKV